MYITINDIIGKKSIDLSYPIHSNKEAHRASQVKIAVLSMLSNNVQYWLQGSIEVLLKTGKNIVLNKGVYMDREPNSLIGLELKSQMLDSRNDVLRCTFQILGGCQGRRTGVAVTTVSSSLILGGWVTRVLKNCDKN